MDPVKDFFQRKRLFRVGDLALVSCRAAEEMSDRIQDSLGQIMRKEFTDATERNAQILMSFIRNNCVCLPRIIKDHNDGEIFVQIQGDVRHKDVHVLQTFPNPNKDLLELYIMCDALNRAGARSITIVAPYLPYQRQDKKDDGRVPITAKLVFNLLLAACGTGKLRRIITFDFHARQAQAFWDGPVDELSAVPLFAAYYRKLFPDLREAGVVSPDAGGAKRAKYLAKLLGTKFYILAKIRTGHGEVSGKKFYMDWDCKDKIAILIDDMFDTAGSITTAASFLQEKGAKVSICGTHAILSKYFDKDKNDWGEAYERMEKLGVKVLTTDSLPEKYPGFYLEKSGMDAICLAHDMAYVIYASQVGLSVSGYLKQREELLSADKLQINMSEMEGIKKVDF